MGNQGFDYNVDIVMCIDATGSMRPILNEVKNNALSFYDKFAQEIARMDVSFEQLRVKVIAFRDYGADEEPMIESKFFKLDEEKEEFYNFVNAIEADGGGDAPENALEAIALAIKSDWSKEGIKRRHFIVVWTDAEALPLGARKDSPKYPADMPKDFDELQDMWEGQEMDRKAKRMIIFAPDKKPWPDMIDWTNTFHQVSQAGKGCSDTDIEMCIHLLINAL